MGSTSHIIERINRIYPSLHPAEKQVAAFVRDRIDLIGSLTVGQLAERCEVSQPTVIRLTRKLGFNGYREFRYAIAHPQPESEALDEAAFNPLEGFNLHPWDNPDDVPHKTVAAATTILNEMLSTLDNKSFRRAVTQLSRARVIDIYAVEDSLAPATDLNTKLSYLGLQSRLHFDPYLQQISAAHLTAADLAVAISYSGSSSDTVKALRLAKNQGASTLGITNNAGTPVANWSDVTLLAGRDSHTIYGNAIFSRISHAALVDMLYMGVILTDYTRYAAVLDASGRAIADRAFEA